MIKQYPMGTTVAASGSEVVLTRVLEAGTGGDAVVCVHGVGSRADRFAPVLEPLADAGYHAYAIDLPGHGLASKGDLPLSVPYYGDFVEAIIRQIPAERVTLLGTSLGGHIGGYMVGVDGSRVDRLVMVGTLGIVPMAEAARQNISRVILRNRSVDDCVGKLQALIWDKARVTREWAEEEAAINNSPGADATFARLGTYFEDEINDDLVLDTVRKHMARVPVGLMWGDRDVIVDVETGHAVRKALPELPMAWIRDTGHAPYWERPQDFVTAMNQLFDPASRGADEFFV